jgi:MoxR-like ATPase
MMPDSAFDIVREDDPDSAAAYQRLDNREPPDNLHSLENSARFFKPGRELLTAVNTALAVEAPLLLTGEPGTGKTQVAYYLREYFHIPLFAYQVRSTSTVDDMKYYFDAVGYLRYAQHGAEDGKPKTRDAYLDKNTLWQAFECETASVLLIDEIDKAPRDFPNDLLQELDQYRFKHPFKDEYIPPKPPRHRPIVVITSNVERRLPDAFLRRCVFHHIELTPQLVNAVVAARLGDFPRLDADTRDKAVRCFWALREDPRITKKPSTAELLVWLTVLSVHQTRAADLEEDNLGNLFGLSVLIKDKDDWYRLRGPS